MSRKSCLAALLLAACAQQAWAITKCTMPDGKVIYQERPCAQGGTTVDVSGAGRADPTSSAARIARAEVAAATRQDQVSSAKARGEPLVGMTEAELQAVMGSPDRANLGNYGGVQSHQLIYDRGDRTWYVYTRNGVVTSIQNSERAGGVSARAQSRMPCPSPLSIRNMETSASSITLGEAERAERWREIREIRARCS